MIRSKGAKGMIEMIGVIWILLHSAVVLPSSLTGTPRKLPRISIGGLMYEAGVHEPPLLTLNSIRQQGPAAELGVGMIRESFGTIFNFSREYLYNKDRSNPADLEDDTENLVAEFYYRNIQQSTAGMALISPCTREQVLIARMSKELDLINFCSVGNSNVVTYRSYPQRINLSIYPISALRRYVTLLFQQNKWTSAVALIDTNSFIREPFHRAMHDALLDAFTNMQPFLGIRYTIFPCNTSVGQEEVEKTLHQLSRITRVVFLFGSGISARTIMQTAKSLGMANGEYVFIMSVLTKSGITIDEQNTKPWILSPANERQNLPFQIYPAASTLVISFVVSLTAKSVKTLARNIRELAWMEYNFTYPGNQIPTAVYAMYEAHLIYGIILNETYNHTGRILGGAEMVRHLLNRTFDLPTGDLYISPYGERTCSILGDVLDSVTKEYVSISKYDYKNDKLVYLIPNELVAWPVGHWPPPNEPLCGFLGNQCQAHSQTVQFTVSAVVGSLAVLGIGAVVAVIVAWNISMGSTAWKLQPEELSIFPNSARKSALRSWISIRHDDFAKFMAGNSEY